MAKYLTVDLRNDNNILSHLFLNCLTPEIIDNIQRKRAANPDADPKKEKLDITIWIEGVAVAAARLENELPEDSVEEIINCIMM